MAWDPAAAYQRLNDMEKSEIVQNEKIRQFLSTAKTARFKEYLWGDTVIRIVPMIDKELRADIEALHTYSGEVYADPTSTEEQILAIENGIYTLIARFCYDEPFSVPQTWEAIDAEAGCAFNVLGEMIQVANSPYAGLKPFRRE